MNARLRQHRAVWLAVALGATSLAAATQQPSQQQPPQQTPPQRQQSPVPQSRNPARSRAQANDALRVQLRTRLTPGVVMRYQIEVQSTSDTTHSGAVQDPQGPSHLIVTWDATVRMEVLSGNTAVSPNTPAGSIRLRTTYEKSLAVVKSDTPDPQAEDIEQQYGKLQGQSIEFTVLPGGAVSDVSGLGDILADENARSAAEQWIKQVSSGAGAPPQGIVPGQMWSSEEPADSLPLAGMFWHTTSTYLQNEPCRPVDPAKTSAPQDAETCAVILTHLSLVTPRKLRDPTPAAYLKDGVHTSGSWSSSGESMNYVSLRNGWVVSVAQNGSEQMDMTFTNASAVAIHYKGTVGTHSTVTLLPNDPASQ